MTDINITMSYCASSDMNTTDFKRLLKDYNFFELTKVFKMEGRYSPFVFNNDYRKSDNYLQNVSNCIVLDFDDGYTREEFKKTANFAYATGTTKSHMKDKNGKVCERFRVIIPTETAIDLNSEEYTCMIKELFEIYPNADQACKDTARAYSGFSGAEVEICPGELFDWEPIHERAVKRKELRRWQQQQKESAKPEFKNDGTKAEWYRDNWLNEKMRDKLKVFDKFVPGNRNTALFSYAKYFKDIQLSDREIESAIGWINNQELDDLEVRQILKGLRIAS